MTRNAEGGLALRTPTTTTQRRKMAIEAWPGAKLVNLEAVEAEAQGRKFTSRVVVGSRVTPLGGGRNRYDYAVYNMNSDRGVATFSVPVGAARVTNVGFKAPRSHGDPWSNDPWQSTTTGGTVTWSTAAHATNPNANAIRWGTMYNFWFEVGCGATSRQRHHPPLQAGPARRRSDECRHRRARRWRSGSDATASGTAASPGCQHHRGATSSIDSGCANDARNSAGQRRDHWPFQARATRWR